MWKKQWECTTSGIPFCLKTEQKSTFLLFPCLSLWNTDIEILMILIIMAQQTNF